MEPIYLMLISAVIFGVLGVPIVWTLSLSGFLAVVWSGEISILVLTQRMYTGANKYAFLAIFFYIFAGSIMQHGGISKRLVEFSNSLVGHIRGGLSMVVIVSCVFFGAISGSGIATTVAIGGVLFPSLVKYGYRRDYAAAVPAAAGMLGTVIPPSISFVLYGTVTNTSIAGLLISGIVPGVLAGGALCAYAYVYARLNKIPRTQEFSLRQLFRAVYSAFLSLLMPFIILGGIYLGVFTPTESAAVAVAYGLFLAVFVYHEVGASKLLAIVIDSVRSTSTVMLLAMAATIFSWLLARYEVPLRMGEFIQLHIDSARLFLLAANILLLVLGMFMDNGAIILILGPLLAPVAVSYGINPVHFGLVMVFNLALGQATPPFGTCLFAAASMSGVKVIDIAKRVIPLCAVIFAVVLLISYSPGLAMWLPEMIKR